MMKFKVGDCIKSISSKCEWQDKGIVVEVDKTRYIVYWFNNKFISSSKNQARWLEGHYDVLS